MRKKASGILFLVLMLATGIFAQNPPGFEAIASKQGNGKRPVILIPGLLGSELVNKYSKEKVWFNPRRSKDDDLKLPISGRLLKNKDNLVPGGILRSIKFLFSSQDFYGKFLDTIAKFGYTETSFKDKPESLKDRFFVFTYDWRLDNVENARLLVRKLKALKEATGEQDIKFDVVAHSMGGLIANAVFDATGARLYELPMTAKRIKEALARTG